MDEVFSQILEAEKMAIASGELSFPSLWSNPISENRKRVDTLIVDELHF